MENWFGVLLFYWLLCGVVFIDEGVWLYLVFNEVFDWIVVSLDCFVGGYFCEVLCVGVVGIFVMGWLLLCLVDFYVCYL